MARFFLLLCLATVFASSTASQSTAYTPVECYTCKDKECEEPQDTWKTATCGTAGQGACVKHVYIDKTTQKETTSRRCVIVDPRSGHTCDQSLGEEKFCGYCSDKKCNSAPAFRSQYGFLFAISLFLVNKCLL